MAKNGSFAFAEVGACAVGQKKMYHLCGCLKFFLKNVRWKKNKKHRVGLRVGLLAVPLQYGLYVFGYLSKWFTFSRLSVKCLFCRVCLYACW